MSFEPGWKVFKSKLNYAAVYLGVLDTLLSYVTTTRRKMTGVIIVLNAKETMLIEASDLGIPLLVSWEEEVLGNQGCQDGGF